MPLPLERYGLIGDTQTAALVGDDGSIDWLCLPRFDSAACFAALLGGPEHGRWLIAPAGEIRARRRRYRPNSLVLETEYDVDGGTVRVTDVMPPRQTDPDLVRVVEGVRGEVRMRMELVVRYDYGYVSPWIRSIDGVWRLIAGPDAIAFTAGQGVEVTREDANVYADFTVKPGERIPFTLVWHRVERGRARTDRRARGDRGHRWLVVRLAASEHGWRGAVARRGRAFLHHLESAHVRADRRHCRVADDVAAGGDRRRAQLGLSLLLAARFHVRAVRADERRLQGGSARVARLAAARGGGRSVEAADHVRPGGRAPPARIRSAVAARLRRLEPRPRRQRRGLAVAARCLRRGDGHAVSRAPHRHSDRSRIRGRCSARC